MSTSRQVKFPNYCIIGPITHEFRNSKDRIALIPNTQEEPEWPSEFSGTMSEENRAMHDFLNTLLCYDVPSHQLISKISPLFALKLHLVNLYFGLCEKEFLSSCYKLRQDLDFEESVRSFVDNSIGVVSIYASRSTNLPLLRSESWIKRGSPEYEELTETITKAVEDVALGYGGWGIVRLRNRISNLFQKSIGKSPDYLLVEKFYHYAAWRQKKDN